MATLITDQGMGAFSDLESVPANLRSMNYDREVALAPPRVPNLGFVQSIMDPRHIVMWSPGRANHPQIWRPLSADDLPPEFKHLITTAPSVDTDASAESIERKIEAAKIANAHLKNRRAELAALEAENATLAQGIAVEAAVSQAVEAAGMSATAPDVVADAIAKGVLVLRNKQYVLPSEDGVTFKIVARNKSEAKAYLESM